MAFTVIEMNSHDHYNFVVFLSPPKEFPRVEEICLVSKVLTLEALRSDINTYKSGAVISAIISNR